MDTLAPIADYITSTKSLAMPAADAVSEISASATAVAALEADWKQALANKIILGHANRTVSIGRSNVCMLQIGSKATTISRRHAEITHSDSAFVLHVIGFNGVRVNGALHMKGSQVTLNTGDEVNFVGIKYKFRAPSVSPSPSLSPESQQQQQHQTLEHEEAEDWWPEPVRKRGMEGNANDIPAGKRVKALASEGTMFGSSADTLVGGSEAGPFDIHDKSEDMCARQLIDCLPPSSPPPVPFLADIGLSDEEIDFDSELLPDAVIQTFEEKHSEERLQPVVEVQATESVVTKPPTSAASVPKKPKHDVGSKENVRPSASTSKDTTAKQSKSSKLSKLSSKSGKKPDDEMMASLRELLGVVDPSECLANAVDSETEDLLTTKPEESISLPEGSSLVDLIVQTMVFSARTSHTISDLLRDMAHADGPEAHAWRHHITWTLFHSKCFGRVERRVKDASDRRAEDKWYYDAARDDCDERRANFGGLVRTARRCTLRDTQYFFKQVPKLPSFRYK
ncbi:hypothetical protein LPJ53_003228 [Coemansia erecta]|uniref:FHA domain-containing protein n=1 Tax=Coemansia erecta TaxID=147472 RepID=A0A9W7Y0D2_9FUNG|nr:hypothetical protein LPJ53_003228 [Coemansia erecta]